jgi:hypothetical protein
MNTLHIFKYIKFSLGLSLAAVIFNPTPGAATGLYATDYDPQGQGTIVRVTTGNVAPYATAQSSFSGGLTADATGNLYATDFDSSAGNYVIAKIVNGSTSNYAIAQSSLVAA